MVRLSRSDSARIGAFTLHSRYDTKVISKPGRDAFLARFEREVDPDGILPEAERKRRADYALKAHMTRLALRSAQARRKAATNG